MASTVRHGRVGIEGFGNVLHGPRPPSVVRVLVAIPCLNEQVAIGSVVLEATRHADEVVVIDDGSKDRTSHVAEAAGATVVRHEENQGKAAAYRTLWDYARNNGADALVVLDGDGQHDPAEIPRLVEALHGADIVIGARIGKDVDMPKWRRAGARVLDAATAISAGTADEGPKIIDSQSGFRAYNRKAIEAIRPAGRGFSVESHLLMDARKAGLRVAQVEAKIRYDVDGSTMGSFRHATGVLNAVLNQIGIRHPLLAMAVPGAVLLALGVFALGFTTIEYQRTGYLSARWLLVGGFSTVLGVLGVTAGLLFQLLPQRIAMELRHVLEDFKESR